MRYDEVVKVIGEPTRCTSVLNARTFVWNDGKKEIDVKLTDDKVVFFSSRRL